MTRTAGRTLIVLIVGALALSARPTQAQNGPYYAVPSWDQTLPNSTRFIVVMGGAAVLDRETGLVWEQAPNVSRNFTQPEAIAQCLVNRTTGGRSGWRLPTLPELSRLLGPTTGGNTPTSFPSGTPFSLASGTSFWTVTPDPFNAGAYYLVFIDPSAQFNQTFSAEGLPEAVWCTQGPSS